MNHAKTKIMSEKVHISVDNVIIEIVKESGKKNRTKEISGHVQLSWTTFGKRSHILRQNKIPINLKRTAYDTCVSIPVSTYGLDPIALTQINANKLHVMQRAMLGVSLKDKIRNEDHGNNRKTEGAVVKPHCKTTRRTMDI